MILFLAGITLRQDGLLTIERVKKDDEGLYECVASNEVGVANTSAVITVLGKSLSTAPWQPTSHTVQC